MIPEHTAVAPTSAYGQASCGSPPGSTSTSTSDATICKRRTRDSWSTRRWTASSRQQVRILAAERSTTIGEVVHELERIRKRRILAVYARSALSGLQPRSLAFSSLYPDAVQRTPLTVGLSALVQHQFRLLQAGRLA